MTTIQSNSNRYTLALAALGIVYGDIGTSPLYAFETVFNNGLQSVSQSEANIFGVLSLFFWCLVIVVTVKYVTIVMRASHSGEGGIIALTCQGNGVTYCNASNTQSTCENTFRKTSPQIRCAWDGSTCRANGAACYASQGGACRTNQDCNSGLVCAAGICESVNG